MLLTFVYSHAAQLERLWKLTRVKNGMQTCPSISFRTHRIVDHVNLPLRLPTKSLLIGQVASRYIQQKIKQKRIKSPLNMPYIEANILIQGKTSRLDTARALISLCANDCACRRCHVVVFGYRKQTRVGSTVSLIRRATSGKKQLRKNHTVFSCSLKESILIGNSFYLVL